jgi:uncharacterized protein (TIGR03437 family)
MNKFLAIVPRFFARLSFLLLLAGCAQAQISSTAYRVLGQPDLMQRGINILQAGSLYGPTAIAIDVRNGQTHLYISDSNNARVLAWQDVHSYQIGNPPDLILGQPGPYYSTPNGIGSRGLSFPTGLAADPQTGNLYVADPTDNRVVRFPSPFANTGSEVPDMVYGQPNFTSQSANSGGTSSTSSSMASPVGVAFDSSENLWVVDSGNNRILRFPAASLNNLNPPAADTVLGQKDFVSSAANRGATVSGLGLSTPLALAFDAQNNLYVSDSGNGRVLKFAGPLGPSNIGVAATGVFGAPNLTTATMAGTPASSSTLHQPAGLSVDSSGKVYVASPADNRVLIFPAAGGAATTVLGQTDFVTTSANTGVAPQASSNTLSSPADVKLDPGGNVYVADSGNNRVLQFAANSGSAGLVWGQIDFSSNGVNQIKPGSLNSPYRAAIDYSQTPFTLYVSDAGNNRVLIWKNATGFHSGDAADLVIGQPNLRTGAANNSGAQGSANPSGATLSGPTGLAVDSAGGLWVADTGNNRVLHYPRPVSQTGTITPDVVLGQAGFNSSNSGLVSASSVQSPLGLAMGPNGELFVADNGNNRVLEFAASPSTNASAIRVFGQPNFISGVATSNVSAQTLTGPTGLFVDAGYNLYIADAGANRVVVVPNISVAATSGTPAAFVIGQSTFSAASPTSLNGPTDVALDGNGNIYISDTYNNRVLMYQSVLFLPTEGSTPTAEIGQQNLKTTSPNWDSTNGLASPDSLWAPLGLYMDRQNTLYVGDSGNNRLLHFLQSAAVVNAADYASGAPIGQGGLATLFGTALANQSAGPANPPFPTSMADRQVVFNQTIMAPIYGITNTQVNFQVPSGAPVGTDQVAVELADTGELIAGGTVLVGAVSPGLFTANQAGTGQAAALNQDGVTVNGSAHPAPVGSVISLFGTGQGPVSPAVPDGNAAPASPLSYTVAVPTSSGQTCLTTQPSVCVAIGNGFGAIQASVLAPNYVGLWQINVQIPSGTPSGNVPVRVVIDGTPSNTVTIAVQ